MFSSARRSTSSITLSSASSRGASSSNCEPIWQSMPTTSICGSAAAVRYQSMASSCATPNLLSLRPVEIYGWVLASTLGLTRSDTRARSPASPATSFKRCNSGIDSTLKQRMSCDSARRISSRPLPTPEKMTFRGSPPAAMTRSNSPPETMSKPEPSAARVFNTARLEFDFTE